MDLYETAQAQLDAHLREISRLTKERERCHKRLKECGPADAGEAYCLATHIGRIHDLIADHVRRARACRTAIRHGL